MKKALFLFLLIPCLLKAQSEKPIDNLFIGIQGGLNVSNYRNYDTIAEADKSTLPLIGLNVTMPFNNYLNVSLGALYSPKGTNYNIYPQPFKIRYNYIDFPVTFQVKTWNFLRFGAGVVPSIVINSKKLYHANNDSVVLLPKNGSGVEVAFQLGAEITLQKGLDLGFSYQIPTSSSAFDNFRFTLTYNFKAKTLANVTKVQDDVAYKQIIDLHNNALLVRLKTSEIQINALKAKGRYSEAEKMQQKQFAINMEIVKAFKSNFNFCPVYFFYGSSSKAIRNHQFTGNLLNDSLVEDSSISYSFKSFYIAEFGYIDPDTIYSNRDLYDQKSYQSDSAFSLSNTRQTEALVIRNSYFTQLKEPFPYYVKMEDWLKRRSYALVAGMFNDRLHYFFKQTMQSPPQ